MTTHCHGIARASQRALAAISPMDMGEGAARADRRLWIDLMGPSGASRGAGNSNPVDALAIGFLGWVNARRSTGTGDWNA